MQQCRVHPGPGRHPRAGTDLLSDAAFDAETLGLLAAERVVRIETKRRNGSVRRRIIWVVVDEGHVFVRSWKGEGAAWYRAAVGAPDELALTVGKTRILVSAQVADDEESIKRCSRALQEKYAGDPATPSMVKPYNLATTLRLSPR